ncbi:cupredoxin family protein [Allohahella marinimesophila]|uniref:Blue (type 1) copper domain-containing protein n=1 Tax=Allohahella marinimesophila TaxID=1054972 RepID=A0ABP7Q6U1_9GAMM
MFKSMIGQLKYAAPLYLVLGSSLVAAHGDKHKAEASGPVDKTQQIWGMAADPGKSDKTITMALSDNMRFSPSTVTVQEGDTVTFKLKNDGAIMHEFVLGTKETLEEHAALMVKFPGMEHSEPYMAHVPPGETREVNWTFNKPGEFDFACLIAGHYQAGMVGTVTVEVK